MKKTSFLLPITMLSMLTVATPAANAAKVYKQTATVYQIKKTGKAYKITSQTKKTADRDLNISKIINVKGKSYYYSKVFKGYINDNAYGVNAKLDDKRAKADSNKDQTTKPTNSNNSNNTNNQNTNIKYGYDYNNDIITDYQTYSNVYIKTVLNGINQHRTENGMQPLTLDSNLSNIANQRATQGYTLKDASWYDGHHDQNGNYFFVNMAKQLNVPYTVFGENTQNDGFSGLDGNMEGPTEAGNATVNCWYIEGNDGAHYRNMMNPQFKKIGIGLYVGPNQGQQTSGGEAEDYTD